MSLRKRPNASLAAAIVLLLLGTPAVSYAGAFFFAGFGNGLNSISHPNGYTGSGASITVTVCIDPASANKIELVTPVQNVVNTFNGLVPTTGNLVFGGNNNIPSGQLDLESVVLHEVGHCLGLAHPNLATESGLTGNDQNYTKSTDGTNNGDEFCNPPGDPGGAYPCHFDIDDGTDNVIGSADDSRGDDDNLHWFRKSNDNPFSIAGTVDSTTYSRNLADLPGSDAYATNADRTVAATLFGLANTEAVMQQGQFSDEAQRTLGHDDVATLHYGMAGVDELVGTGDDYTFSLSFVGESNSCDVVISMENIAGLAFCSSGGSFIGGTDHVQMAQNVVKIDSVDFTWFFNDVSNGACSIDADLVLNNQSVGGTVERAACETITATNYTVQSTADVTLRAGSKIVLGDGFNVQSGGSFVAEIDPGIN